MSGKKYKILIIDDEYWTREKLRNMIQWEQYGMECLEPAKDGEDALQKIAADCPDIIITDINMPFMDGVELIRRVCKSYPQVLTLVLSGYDDYQYVRDTLTLGAIDYLMKPVTKVNLVNVLSRALEVLGKRKSSEAELMRASSLLQDRELSGLIKKESAGKVPRITMNLNLDFTGYSLTLIKLHGAYAHRSDRNAFSMAIKSKIKSVLSQDDPVVFNHIYRPNEYILIVDMDLNTLTSRLQRLLVDFDGKGVWPVTVVVGNNTYTLDSIYSAYTQSVSRLMTRPFQARSLIIGNEAAIDESLPINRHFSAEKANSLRVLLESGNKQNILRFIRKTIGLGQCAPDWSLLEVRQAVRRLVDIGLSHLPEGARERELELESLGDAADGIADSLDQEQLDRLIDQIVDASVGLPLVEISDTIASTVRQVAAYIGGHYFEELTLSGLAQKFMVESSYLSKAFSQQIGENLTMYIARFRIEKACRHICEATGSLTEISYLVGYDDYTYFSRVFKKVTGQSPREYKTSVGR